MEGCPDLAVQAARPTAPPAKLSLIQLWNMNFGFLGIEFGWSLQMTNMSAIFERLGAHADQLPLLWIAAPLTGLIVQPLIGNLSDHTWGPLGRRRPYFLVGAILGSTTLLLMPHVTSLWMAVSLLWILDTSANISMEPFRAFVGDLLPQEQRTRGFATQSLMIGMGAVSAASLPWVLNHVFAIDHASSLSHRIPQTVEISFELGAVMYLCTVLWTVFTTPEHPPKNLECFQAQQAQRQGWRTLLKETKQAFWQMPTVMKQLARVQFFTWLGIFCFFLYFPPAVAHHIFGAHEQGSALYSAGVEWAGLCFAVLNSVCVAFSFALPWLAYRLGRPLTHGLCLFLGGLCLISLLTIHNPYGLLVAMMGFGVTWASVLSMPYAMLVEELPPQQRGMYMGIFNFFIVLPQILISLGFGWIMHHFLHNNRLMAVVVGGGFLLIAAALTAGIKRQKMISWAGTAPTATARPEAAALNSTNP